MAGRPIKIDLVADDSQLKKTLKGAGQSLGKFGKSIAKLEDIAETVHEIDEQLDDMAEWQ